MQRLAVALIFLAFFSMFATVAVMMIRRSASGWAQGVSEGSAVPRIAYFLLIALTLYVAATGMG